MKKLQRAAEWVLSIGRQDKRGHEIPDPNQLAIPAGFKRPDTLAEQVRRLVRQERLNTDEQESWDEANDFDVDDDFDPSTPWETIYDPHLEREISPHELKEQWPQIQEEFSAKLRNRYRLEELERAEKRLVEGVERNRGAGVSPAPSPSGEPPKGPEGPSQ